MHRRWAGPRGRRSRLGCYLRARLHRRIFLNFGVAILLTGLVVSILFAHSMGLEGTASRHEAMRTKAFLANRFSLVWDDPLQRAELADTVAGTMNLFVELRDERGRPVAVFGAGGVHHGHGELLPIVRGGRVVGQVRLFGARRGHSKGLLVAALLIAGLGLWIAARALAHRLARPLVELEAAVREIGAGNLKRRVELDRVAGGEVEVVAEAVNEMAARIEKQLADQRELLAAVSHEMRTPLGHLRVLVELARDGGADPETMDEMERELVEADRLIDELLASSRLEFAATNALELEACEVARRAAQRAALPADLLQLPPSPLPFVGDPTLIARALANLLENARVHGGGATALRVRQVDGAVAFEVDDAGPGLGDGDAAQLFESFRRGSGAPNAAGQAEKGSLGLGLALVARIARAHGGEVGAEDLEGGGARVWLRLPAAPATGGGASATGR